MRYDLVDLRLFVHIGDALNITRAAQRSWMSLPAASTRVRHLEDVLGTPLLQRHSKGVQLTPAGEILVAYARDVLRRLECMHADLAPFSAEIKGRVTLLVNATAVSSFVPDALRSFRAEYPYVDVELEEHLSPQIVARVASGAADLGIVARDVPTGTLESLPLAKDEFVLIVPEDDKLASTTLIDALEVIDGRCFVGMPQTSAIEELLTEVARRRGKKLEARIHVGSYEAACRMVAARIGITIIPRSSAAPFARTLGLTLVDLSNEWAQAQLRLIRRPNEDLPSFCEVFVGHLIRCARDASGSASAQPMT